MKQKRIFLFFCMIIAANAAFSQYFIQGNKNIQVNTQRFFNNAPVFNQYMPIKILPQGLYYSQLGFFCKTELKFESATKVPFKFRLGSVSYNDWLEGKKNAGIIPAY